MTRYAHNADEGIRQRSGWFIPLAVFFITFALAAVVLIFYLAPPPPSFFREPISFSARTDIVELKVHHHKFYIPANYLKYGSDRQGGERADIKLAAIFPGMRGYSGWEDSAFKNNAADSSVVEMLIHDDAVMLRERDWLNRIYMPYVANPKGAPAFFGLTQYAFRADSGYRGEDLFVGQGGNGPIVIQCVRLTQQVPSPACHRELPIAHGVALSYRFKRAHLTEWREIGDSTEKLVRSFRQEPAP